jgi:hypothetical protein
MGDLDLSRPNPDRRRRFAIGAAFAVGAAASAGLLVSAVMHVAGFPLAAGVLAGGCAAALALHVRLAFARSRESGARGRLEQGGLIAAVILAFVARDAGYTFQFIIGAAGVGFFTTLALRSWAAATAHVDT